MIGGFRSDDLLWCLLTSVVQTPCVTDGNDGNATSTTALSSPVTRFPWTWDHMKDGVHLRLIVSSLVSQIPMFDWVIARLCCPSVTSVVSLLKSDFKFDHLNL